MGVVCIALKPQTPPAEYQPAAFCYIPLFGNTTHKYTFTIRHCRAYISLSLSSLYFFCHARAYISSSVMFGLGVDSWRDRAISEVRGLRDERGPTQLGIYTRAPLDSPAKTGNDRKRNVIVGLDPTIPKTQSTCSRYARRKQRVSTKIHAAAGAAGKLATTCVIQDFQKNCNFCTRHPLYKLFKLRLEPLSPHNTHNFPE